MGIQVDKQPEAAGQDRGMRDLLYYFPSKAFPALFGAVQVMLLTRGLGPDGYGRVAIGIAAAGVLVSLSSDWLRQSILRFFPLYQASGKLAEFRQKTWTLLLLALSFVLVGFLALGAIFPGAVSTTREDIILVLIVSSAMVLFHYQATLLQSGRQSRQYAVATFIQSLTQLVLIAVLVLVMEGGAAMALLSIAAGYGAGLTFMMLTRATSSERSAYLSFRLDRGMAKQMASYGLPMAIWFLSAQLSFLIPRYVIGRYRTFDEVGLFSSSYDLINGSMSLLMTPFLLASVPIIMYLWETGHRVKAIQDLIASNIRYISLVFAPLIVLAILSGQYAIGVFLGEDFTVTPWIVPMLVIGSLLGGFSMYAHKGLEVGKRTHIMLMASILALGVNAAVNLMLVPFMGYPAAALAIVISSAFYMVATGWLGRHFLTNRIPWRSLWHIAVAAACGALLSFLTRWCLGISGVDSVGIHIVGSIVAVLVYGLLLLFQRELNEEFGLLRSTVQHYIAKVHQAHGL